MGVCVCVVLNYSLVVAGLLILKGVGPACQLKHAVEVLIWHHCLVSDRKHVLITTPCDVCIIVMKCMRKKGGDRMCTGVMWESSSKPVLNRSNS